MKKIISLMLALAMMFTIAIPAFAEEAMLNEPLVSIAEEEQTSVFNPEEWGDKPVARVYLCATINSFTGHLWLYVINLTPYELPLGYVTLKPYEEMSVGSLRNTRKDGGGTYYNGEAYMADDLGSLRNHTTSLYTDITYGQLIIMGNKIKSRNTYILIGDNCGDFACACWNTIAPSGKKVINVLVPIFTIINIAIVGGERGQIEMKRPDISRVFKQERNGVRQANPQSFNASCVNW